MYRNRRHFSASRESRCEAVSPYKSIIPPNNTTCKKYVLIFRIYKSALYVFKLSCQSSPALSQKLSQSDARKTRLHQLPVARFRLLAEKAPFDPFLPNRHNAAEELQRALDDLRLKLQAIQAQVLHQQVTSETCLLAIQR